MTRGSASPPDCTTPSPSCRGAPRSPTSTGGAPRSPTSTAGLRSTRPRPCTGPPGRPRRSAGRAVGPRGGGAPGPKKERRRTGEHQTRPSRSSGERIPNVPADTKLSKIKTLRLATSYICYLMDVLAAEPRTRRPRTPRVRTDSGQISQKGSRRIQGRPPEGSRRIQGGPQEGSGRIQGGPQEGS
ncbi:hypothetical protein CRUP_032701 [Coryphaenoides rupestris]|nr:hypothetical protein CRUP_032701 [Coryphaenoides rupestris]